jgi:hypothetical protein
MDTAVSGTFLPRPASQSNGGRLWFSICIGLSAVGIDPKPIERGASMLRTFVSTLMVIIVALSLPPAEGNQKGRLNQLMADKLRFSQGLLQGIALSDFPKIISNAQDLLALSKTAEWLANNSPKYLGHSDRFQLAAETLIEKAKDKNIDGVVLAFQDLTMSCVRCHKYLREVRDARAPFDAIDPTVLVRRR